MWLWCYTSEIHLNNGPAFTSQGISEHLKTFSQIIHIAGAEVHHKNFIAVCSIISSITSTLSSSKWEFSLMTSFKYIQRRTYSITLSTVIPDFFVSFFLCSTYLKHMHMISYIRRHLSVPYWWSTFHLLTHYLCFLFKSPFVISMPI